MYHITDGNEHQRIADWDTMIATLESWFGWLPKLDYSDVLEGDVAALNAAARANMAHTGYYVRVEEVA